jgi:hypothetical protein
MRSTLMALFALLAGCAPSKDAVKPTSTEDQKPIATAGSRCQGGTCACRRVDDRYQSIEAPTTDEGAVAEGHKRFEVRTGRGLDGLTLTVEGRGTLTKATNTPEPACAYIDLPPGKHRVKVRAVAANAELGQVPSFFISEYSADKQSWYDTFRFRCGGTDSVCEQGHMDEWVQMVRATPRGLFDPCGSVRVEGVKWNAERAVGVKLAELEVELMLNVYKFPPRFKHGVASCKGPAAE